MPTKKKWSRPWQRLGYAFRPKITRAQVAGGVLLAVLGFAATVQVRALSADDDHSTATRTQLVQILDGLDQRSERLEGELSDLNAVERDLKSGADKRRTATEQAEERARTLGVLAGTLPASGPGITMIITENQGRVSSSVVLNALEELRDAGAEAIEINDKVRVVADTYVDDGKEGLVVDGTTLRAPYSIDVIGDAKTLATGMRIPGGVIDEVQKDGAVAAVTEQEVVEIDALRETSEPRYARPAEKN